MQSPDFITIGENIHTTRVLMRNGSRVVQNEEGQEGILYKDSHGPNRFMGIPDYFKRTQVFQEGRVKHFMVAIHNGMSDCGTEQEQGKAYISAEILRQERYGSNFLDLNVDELSPHIDVQKRAMRWLVGIYSSLANVPPSKDSSSQEILQAGLEEYSSRGSPQGIPLVNSASLERVNVLDLVVEHNTEVMVTSAGSGSMPSDEQDRVANAHLILEQCKSRGIGFDRVHIDALLFPISVDQRYGNHYLDAVKLMRREFGGEIRISGGLSNVSFGLPARRLINDTFIRLAVEAGVNSGIVNPVESQLERIMNLDMDSVPVGIAKRMLLGDDEFCMDFISSFREGKLS